MQGEFIDVVVKRKNVRSKIVSSKESASGSKVTYVVLAAEADDGNPPGHREATEKDFER